MASSLSEEEFQRIQLQLLELKTANYELDGKYKRLEKELEESAAKIGMLERDLSKANKVISKSKKVKEVEILVQENDAFQRKLLSQEEEFRLQHQTLMAEISSLTAANEELEKKCGHLDLDGEKNVGSDKGVNKIMAEMEDQVRHYEAQNLALQKNLSALQEKYDKDMMNMKEQQRLNSGSGGQSHSDDSSEERREEEEEEESDKDAQIKDRDAQIKDLQLHLDTEREEKRLLREQLNKVKGQNDDLEEEVKKLDDMMKRKQESYLQVQSEKELMSEENKKKSRELQEARDRDQKYYQERINKLQQEVKKAQETASSSDGQKEVMQQKVSELQKQVDAANIVSSHQLQEKDRKHQKEIKDLTDRMTDIKQKHDDLAAQFHESKRAGQEAFAQLLLAQQERDSQSQLLQEVDKVAEKRKTMLDELAIKYQSEHDAHNEQRRTMEEKHQTEVKSLNEEINTLQLRVQDLRKSQSLMEEMQSKVKSLNDNRKQLESKLKDTEDQLQKSRTELEDTKESLESLHQTELQALREEQRIDLMTLKDAQEQQKKEWDEKEAELQQQISSLKSDILLLNQHIKDGVGEKKIHEKKGMTMVKDLKKQLLAERKRAEKLQERLQEILSQSGITSSEDLFQASSPVQTVQGDSSSVSSWGAGSSSLKKDSVANGPQSPTASSLSTVSSSPDPVDDYAELLRKLAATQEQKWALEEKVEYLETSNACMADDLLKKTAIIQHHVMHTSSTGGSKQSPPDGGGADKRSLKKPKLETTKSNDHSELRDMNRKLQLMLEETLTKNLHLQQDMESMSQDLVRLSRLATQSSSTTPEEASSVQDQVQVEHEEDSSAANEDAISPTANLLSTRDDSAVSAS